MELNTGEYFRQIIYAFNKLTELSFDKSKLHNVSLIVGIRTILTTLEYDADSEVDITTAIFQIGILLKKSRLLSIEHIDQQLLKDVEAVTRDRKAKKCSPSPV